MSKAFFTIKEVAEILGLGRGKTYELVSSGQIPSVLLGGRSRRVPALGLQKFIDRQTRLAVFDSLHGEDSDLPLGEA